jgi:hypothetical protein
MEQKVDNKEKPVARLVEMKRLRVANGMPFKD